MFVCEYTNNFNILNYNKQEFFEEMSIYLDCNATTPIEPAVAELVRHYMEVEYGNSGSRTHIYGLNAKNSIEKARQQIANVVEAQKDEVIFTSGATESNNLAILGLATALKNKGKTHIVTSAIEHKAVLEPCGFLESQGFKVSFLEPDSNGAVSLEAVKSAITESTGLLSIMNVNNETGVIQPIAGIAGLLEDSDIFFHVDAAQGFGKLLAPLTHSRIDLISVSAHKIYGPKGIGALITRRRNYKRPPLTPLVYGGGQEKGLRAGTLPVPLIAGFGLAAELAVKKNKEWWLHCENIQESALASLKEIDFHIHGENTLPNVINFSVKGINSEAAIVALKGVAAISNGSACTSNSYSPSHVLAAMNLEKDEIQGALRVSWCHMTKEVPWREIVSRLQSLL
jgi:cysteine desulfurase